MGLADIGLSWALNTGQRREEQRRWKEYGEPMAKQQLWESQAKFGTPEQQGGIEQRRTKLSEDEFTQRQKEFADTLTQKNKELGIRLTEDQTRRLRISSDIFLHAAQYADDDITNRTWDNSTLGEVYGKDQGFKFTPKGELRGGISDSGVAWKWDLTKPGGPTTYDMSKQGLGKMMSQPKTGDYKSGLLSILTKYKSAGSSGSFDPDSEEGQNAYRNLQTAAQNPEHPQYKEAQADFMEYQQIENRMREIMGMQGRALPTGEDQARGERQYWLKQGVKTGQSGQNRLQNMGDPSQVAPQGKPLDRETAGYFLQQAGGDPEKARQLAREQGYTF